jgi:hypothetical protein
MYNRSKTIAFAIYNTDFKWTKVSRRISFSFDFSVNLCFTCIMAANGVELVYQLYVCMVNFIPLHSSYTIHIVVLYTTVYT